MKISFNGEKNKKPSTWSEIKLDTSVSWSIVPGLQIILSKTKLYWCNTYCNLLHSCCLVWSMQSTLFPVAWQDQTTAVNRIMLAWEQVFIICIWSQVFLSLGESIRPCATQASKRSARVLGQIINVVPLSKEKFKNTEKKSWPI